MKKALPYIKQNSLLQNLGQATLMYLFVRRKKMYAKQIFKNIAKNLKRGATSQYFLAIISILLLLPLLLNFIHRDPGCPKKPFTITRSAVQENILNDLPIWDKNVLIDIGNFQYITSPQVCHQDQPLDILAFVISAPGHFETRQAIRKTWARSRPTVKVLFALGIGNNSTIQTLIHNEYMKYRDVLQGYFIDSYRNLTYKASMCLKYAVYFCQNAKYYIKADDDFYVNVDDVLGFIKELEEAEGNKKPIFCRTIVGVVPFRSNSKWAVTKEEYFSDNYPTYCQGVATMFTFDTIYRLYQKVQIMHYFWVDDVHITGTIRSVLDIAPTDIVKTYLFDETGIDNFIKSNGSEGSPEIIFFIYAKGPERFYQIYETFQKRRKTLNISFLEKLKLV